MADSLHDLERLGQSIWYDFIHRRDLRSGGLRALVERGHVRGVTSNPSIFEKAIGGGTDYDDQIAAILRAGDVDPGTLYERVAVDDIRAAADTLRPVYDASRRRDGYVSLEVSPYLANDTERTIAEARRLWATVGRPNLMIKIPGTAAGVPAIRTAIGDGINVNVTLLFARERYEEVAEAFVAGLEERAAAGRDVSGVASVASFFVSRIDTLVDAQLEQRGGEAAERLRGRVAIANAKLAYRSYGRLFGSSRWQTLAARGATTQRLLWASTGTKNPRYSDTLYVDELIGRDTVNTVPVATYEAFRDHGRVRATLTEGVDDAERVMAELAATGISIDAVTAQLVDDGVQLFADAFDQLLAAVARKRAAVLDDRFDGQKLPSIPAATTALEAWRRSGGVRRLWDGDATLWTGGDESRWIGWLGLPDAQLADLGPLTGLADEMRREGLRHVVVLGMGGSSLFPETLRATFGPQPGFPAPLVLDSTVPAQVRAVERAIDPARTLFVVSSKSGSTIEPNGFLQYFFERVRQAVGAERAGRHFVAVTDPGSSLEKTAVRDGFRRVYPGVPSVGGRYSALSNFGMVPAAAMGLDVRTFLESAARMAHGCAASVPPAENPGVALGVLLGTLAKAGRDKVTIIASPAIAAFGTWLEQLIAESTGKRGTALVPVDGEEVGAPEVYGSDRVFAYLRMCGPSGEQDRKVAAIEAAGHPVVRIDVRDAFAIGQECFRWEIATAVAGAVLDLDPFDQPDVEAAKVAARTLMATYEQTGAFAEETPALRDGGARVFATAAVPLADARTLDDAVRALLATLRAGDYFAVNAYVAPTPEHDRVLHALRHRVRDRRRVATTLGYGPRFLHSTGQLHKGGPNTGVFLQISADDAEDLPIPGQRYTFGVLARAQAVGDYQVLAKRGRRVLHVRLGPDVDLARVARAVDAAT